MRLYSFADVILSSSIPLSELPSVSDQNGLRSKQIFFSLADERWVGPGPRDWIHHWDTPEGERTLSLAKDTRGFLLGFPSLGIFHVSEAGTHIQAWPGPETDLDTLRHLLLDQVMPRVLSHCGELVLHAAGVSVAGRVVAFAGDTGFGKSTLAASFHASGFPLLSDDGLVVRSLRSGVQAIPGYRGLRLLPATQEVLLPNHPQRAPFSQDSEKGRVVLDSENPIPTSADMAALFVLAPRATEGDGNEVDAVRLSPRDACMELMRHSFQLDMTDSARTARLLAMAGDVAESLPVFSLSFPREYSCLPAVQECVLGRIGSQHPHERLGVGREQRHD